MAASPNTTAQRIYTIYEVSGTGEGLVRTAVGTMAGFSAFDAKRRWWLRHPDIGVGRLAAQEILGPATP